MRPWQQEKHYVQSMILNAISELPVVFKGGTYLWFFHGLRRFSEDLDFTASDTLPNNIPKIVSHSLELFGIENELKIIADNEITLSFRISAKGPLNTSSKDRCFVYVEISKRECLVEKNIPIKFDYAAYQLPIKRLLGMNLDEVGSEKVRAIITRQKARDIYDLYYLISKKGIKFKDGLVNKKLEYYKIVFSNAGFIKELKHRKETYLRELKGIVFDEIPAFNEVERTLDKWLANGSKL